MLLNGRFTATNLDAQRARPGHHLSLGNRRELSMERLAYFGSCRTTCGSDSAGGAVQVVRRERRQRARHLSPTIARRQLP